MILPREGGEPKATEGEDMQQMCRLTSPSV